jgi:hypothetical protein
MILLWRKSPTRVSSPRLATPLAPIGTSRLLDPLTGFGKNFLPAPLSKGTLVRIAAEGVRSR